MAISANKLYERLDALIEGQRTLIQLLGSQVYGLVPTPDSIEDFEFIKRRYDEEKMAHYIKMKQPVKAEFPAGVAAQDWQVVENGTEVVLDQAGVTAGSELSFWLLVGATVERRVTNVHSDGRRSQALVVSQEVIDDYEADVEAPVDLDVMDSVDEVEADTRPTT